MISEKDIEFINNFADNQREYGMDTEIENLKRKWDSDKYFYDEDEARKFYKFVSKLQLDKGKKGQHIKLLKFQFKVLTEILCVKNRETGLRRHKECLLDIGRKNGKGTITALIIIYLFFTDSTFGAEYIIVANEIKQATNLFNTISLMIKTNRTLAKYVKITESKRQMYRKATNSYLRILSNDGSNLDSYATYVMVCDEAHEYKNADAYKKLRTGMGLWEEPICLITTTASNGQDPNNLEMMFYNYAKDIQAGKFEDEKFYFAIYEAKEDCGLDDVEEWVNANPALGNFRRADDLADFMLKAGRLKSLENDARRLYLNQHVQTDGENAINMQIWRECLQDIRLEDLRGMVCWCALDMSQINDITAYVLVFYDRNTQKYIIFPLLFTPKDNIKERSDRDKVDYIGYVNKKELITLNGNYINTEELFNCIDSINRTYGFKTEEIAFDRWGADDIRNKLEDRYIIFPFGQGYKSMTPTIRDFEIMMYDKRLVIANNSMLTWMAANTVATIDPAGNIKYDKSKSKNKIDGIIAMIMALSRAIYNNGEGTSVEDALNSMNW